MAKVLTLEQSLALILSKPIPKAKLNLAEVWPKVQPFLLMIATFIPAIAKYVNALIAAMTVILSSKGGKAKVNLTVIWPKVRPFLQMAASVFGKKVSVYINAFIAGIDVLLEATPTV